MGNDSLGKKYIYMGKKGKKMWKKKEKIVG